ncbi:MAG: Flp pilus assembly complex ATPase component TadA [Candidatus Eremiobacteraeota bacterium]|nr:Flp pilus assembly complex ATPase component TadA [Candidatus Eremiobacteraeota bacterium]
MSASVITIIGAKGGVGSTTLSYELAQALSKRGRIALVDGDFGGRRTIALLTNCVKELDEARDESNNLSFVTLRDGITAVELAHNIHAGFTLKPEKVEALVQNFAQTGTSAIVDAPQPFAAAIRPFIVRCAKFFLVVEPTLLGLAGGKAMMAELQKFGISISQIAAVSVQRDAHSEFAKNDIERALGVKLAAEIPPKSDRRYARAVEQLVEYASGFLSAQDQTLDLGPSIRSPLGDRRLAKLRAPTQLQPGMEGRKTSGIDHEKIERIKASTHEALTKRLDLAASRDRSDPLKAEELQKEVQMVVNELITEEAVGSAEEVAQLRQEVIDEALGYGPIEDLLRDPDVTEIMANGPDHIYVERGGRLQLSSKRFTNERQLRLVIERMIAPIGRRIDESTPMVDGRLPDGSRINAIIEPLAISGATLTIRRFGTERLHISNLLEKRSLVPGMVDFLRACVEGRLNIVVSGGTGSGKTTLLNILSSFIPESDRIITIEDAAELKMEQDHVVRLEARPPNLEGRGEIRIRDLVRNALRMRPDRIIVGECRGGEALDMLQAMNTGHDGSLTTIHANTPRDCLSRIETMVMMAGFDLPSRAIREQVSNAIDLVVQVARLRDGSRKIIAITEVVGMEGETVTTQDIVTFAQRGLDKEGRVVGDFVYSGVQPNCVDRFSEYGISYDIRGLSEMTAAIKW